MNNIDIDKISAEQKNVINQFNKYVSPFTEAPYLANVEEKLHRKVLGSLE